MKPRPWVYVAAPYTKGDVVENVRAAVLAGQALWERGYFPYIPHLTHFQHMICPQPYEHWLEFDLYPLLKCDILLRLPGESSGADKEVAVADEHLIEVVYGIDELPELS